MTEKAAATEGEPQHRRMLQRVVEPVQRCSVIVSKLAVDVRPLIRSQGDSQLNCRSAAERGTSACPIFFAGEMSLFSAATAVLLSGCICPIDGRELPSDFYSRAGGEEPSEVGSREFGSIKHLEEHRG